MKFRLTIASFLVITSFVSAQEKPAGTVWGYIFGDYYYKLTGNAAEAAPSQYSKTEKDMNAFHIRRMYLGYDHTFSTTFSGQLLLESNDKSLENGGRYGFYVKTAYLEWREIFQQSNLFIGLIPTQTIHPTEKFWIYRPVEKVLIDYRGLGPATDIGVALRGKLNSQGTVAYSFMIGNGTAQKPENNKYKKFYGLFDVKPIARLTVEGYFDYEPAANASDKTTWKILAAYEMNNATIGVEALQQIQKSAGVSGADKVPFGWSVFSWLRLNEKINAFGRIDHYIPDIKTTNADYEDTFFTIGIDYSPVNNIHVMPNLWINTFSDRSPRNLSKDADVVARLTFFFVFK
ncbi:MAG: hypothetical protein V1799_00220 [bacterium]